MANDSVMKTEGQTTKKHDSQIFFSKKLSANISFLKHFSSGYLQSEVSAGHLWLVGWYGLFSKAKSM